MTAIYGPITVRTGTVWDHMPTEIKRELAVRRIRSQENKPARVKDIEYDYIIEQILEWMPINNRGYKKHD